MLRLIILVFAMVAVATALGWAILAQVGLLSTPGEWILATGQQDGLYRELGEALVAELSDDDAVADLGEVRTHGKSRGSHQNARLLAAGEVQFALVQSDTELVEDARLVSPLYEEVLHVVVRRDSAISSIRDLKGLSINRFHLGQPGSGTLAVASRILEHLGILPHDAETTGTEAPPARLLAEGEIDAAFLLTGAGSKSAEELLSDDRRLVGFESSSHPNGPARALATIDPHLRPAVIPVALYGAQPRVPVSSISVSALLVTRKSVDEDIVRELTRVLYDNRHNLGVPLRLPGSEETDASYLPYHEGALQFHLREEPTFLVQYAEVISLLITLLVGIWSITNLYIRWRAGLKKERIDKYYERLQLAGALESNARLTELRHIHRKAFDELMSEQLAADESFVIFHDYLLSEITRTEAELHREA